MLIKRLMLVNRKAPYGSVYALEALEVALVSAAFDQQVCLAFLDDGVYQLMSNQQPAGIGHKPFFKAFYALGDYDIRQLYVERESLVERGLQEADLMQLTWEDEEAEEQKPSVIMVDRPEMAELMAAQDVVLSF